MFQTLLDVPYLIQPTPITCQSTCLKMFAMYLEKKFSISVGAKQKKITNIWKEINEGTKRPSKLRNSYENMEWWLEQHFCPQQFEIYQTTDVDSAISRVRSKIDAGFPVMVSTNHDRTSGHIILVVGYQPTADAASCGIEFICHDPYGKFDPQLSSKVYGGRRFEGATCNIDGSECGPGKFVIYDYDGIRRVREDRHSTGKFYLISAET